jgi:hypothetical protein
MPPPTSLTTVYATDEDVVSLAGADFQVLAGRWFVYASGADGVFSSSDLWTLNSASQNFVTQGLKANMVCQLLGPKPQYQGSGDLLAIETVAAHALTLRRVGQALGIGLPPGPAGGITGVTFLVTSLQRQLEDTAYLLNEQFAVDPNTPNRTPGDIYDQRILRRLTVYQVVYRQYMNLNRSKAGDFADKIDYYRDAYQTELAAAIVRWGPNGQTQQSSTRFSTHLVR